MSDPRRIVLVSLGAYHARERLRPLDAAGFELVERFDLDNVRDEAVLVEALDGAFATVAGSESYTRGTLARLPHLRAIARSGVGYDAVDVAAATDCGIVVLTTPGANADSVADCALMLMLACRRRLLVVDGATRAGRWRLPDLAGDLAQATVGIVGLGAIGRAVARRLHGFDCRLLAVEPCPDEEFCASLRVELVSLEDLLSRADVVTLHMPLTSDTRYLIGEPELALMKPEAVLVNTARGGAIDEQALVAALESGRLAGAGLDVFEHEPLSPDDPLTRLTNVVLSAHSASFTRLGVDDTADAVARNLLDVAAGRLPPSCVNPTAWRGESRS
jgi:D-3-phosphoglycerate dehydrogenase